MYNRPVIPEPVIEMVVPTVHVTNIQAIPELRVEDSYDKRREKKKKRLEEKEAEKKAKANSLQDEQDWKTRVREIAVGTSGLRPPGINAKGGSFMPSTIVVQSFLVDRMIADNSGTQFEGPHTDIVDPMP